MFNSQSLRKQLRITPKEEDAIADEFVNMFVDLLESNMKAKVADRVDALLNMETEDDDILRIKYSLSVNAGAIKMFLNRMRKGRKKPLELNIQG